MNSGNLINHLSMNWGQFFGYPLLPVPSWRCGIISVSYARGCRLETHFFYKNIVNEFTEFSESHLGKNSNVHNVLDSVCGDQYNDTRDLKDISKRFIAVAEDTYLNSLV